MTSAFSETGQSKQISILLAEDHKVVRQGLRALLEAEPYLHVVGEAGNGREAIRMVERLRPKVLVVDLMMPELSGLEVTRQLRKRSPKTRVVVLFHASGRILCSRGAKKWRGSLRAEGRELGRVGHSGA